MVRSGGGVDRIDTVGGHRDGTGGAAFHRVALASEQVPLR
jgi:hypothetical protein